jgi:hypothetical protein
MTSEVQMKMVKSLLLGSAAGLTAVTGAQAADAPVKARPAPVEYVRICSLYGEGFWYVPGTDSCLKIGGYWRIQAETHAGSGGIVDGSANTQARFTRDHDNEINYRVRGVISIDARQQTDYGTLRSYLRAGWENTTPGATGGGTAATAFWDRAFLQFVGFTVGRAQSFFDVWTSGGFYNYNNVRTTGDTGATGQNLWAYTAQLGNGVSASVSLEDPVTRKGGTIDVSQFSAAGVVTPCVFFPVGASPAPDNAFAVLGATGCAAPAGGFGFRVPDIIANLRIDQAWGWAGASVALHDVSGAYYLNPNSVNNGHPADKYGWAATIGAQFNVGTTGDTWGFEARVGEGTPGYMTNSPFWQIYNNSNRIGVAWVVDGVFDGLNQEVELTRAWSVNAAYQHFWNRKWRTSWYGGYVQIDYNDRATALICSNRLAPNGASGGIPLFGVAQPVGFNCDPSFSFYQVGSRTQWNPVPQLDIGLDILYTKLNTAFNGPANFIANGSRPACSNLGPGNGGCSVDDQHVLSAMFRWQRNFFP